MNSHRSKPVSSLEPSLEKSLTFEVDAIVKPTDLDQDVARFLLRLVRSIPAFNDARTSLSGEQQMTTECSVSYCHASSTTTTTLIGEIRHVCDEHANQDGGMSELATNAPTETATQEKRTTSPQPGTDL